MSRLSFVGDLKARRTHAQVITDLVNRRHTFSGASLLVNLL